MIKVSKRDDARQLPMPAVGDCILLDLTFGNQQFSMTSILEVVEMQDAGGIANFEGIHSPSTVKTFKNYDEFVGQSVSFQLTDLLDVEPSSKGADE